MYTLILHGRRLVQLQNWRNFQNGSAFSNSFFSTSNVASDVSSKDTLSRKADFENLLRSHGFTDSQISSIITVYPRLVIEKLIGPKLQFLQSRGGASSSELTEIISKVPRILGMKGNKTISVYYDFVKDIIEADKSSKFVKLCHSSLPQEGSKQGNKMRNLSILRDFGVPQKLLFQLLISDNRVCCGTERFEETLDKVLEMGFDPKTSTFVQALQVLYQMTNKTTEEKLDIYTSVGFAVEDVWEIFNKCPIFLARSEKKILNSVETFLGLGFSRDEFLLMVKRSPACTGLSAETVREKNEFLVKTMNWPLKAVVLHPQVFTYSMEKRIVPRCNVIKALMAKGFLEGKELPPLSSVLSCTDHKFLKRYVMKHEEKLLVPELMSYLQRKSCFVD